HQRGELTAATVDRESPEVAVDVSERAADVSHQLDHVVFADVHDVERAGAALEDLAGHRLADGAGAADDQESAFAHLIGKRGSILPYIRLEQGAVSADQIQHVHASIPTRD